MVILVEGGVILVHQRSTRRSWADLHPNIRRGGPGHFGRATSAQSQPDFTRQTPNDFDVMIGELEPVLDRNLCGESLFPVTRDCGLETRLAKNWGSQLVILTLTRAIFSQLSPTDQTDTSRLL